MRIEFDYSQIRSIQFGVGRMEGAKVQFYIIAADDRVQDALRDEAREVLCRDILETTDPRPYDPAEKYESEEYLVLPLEHELSTSLARLHNSVNLVLIPPRLEVFEGAFSYFMRGTDKYGRRLTALNRAAQFKGAYIF